MDPKLRHLEDLIRSNQTSAVGRELGAIHPKDVPRDQILTLANIARRAGFPQFSLKFLDQVLHSEELLHVPASPRERAEYAIALSEIGMSYEALALLDELDSARFPEFHFYSAFVLFSLWKYDEAIPRLLQYVQSPGLSDYQKLVANVNLAAAFIVEFRLEEADVLLAALREETIRNPYQLLHGNCLELSAQLAILNAKTGEARDYLDRAKKVFAGSNTIYEYFVRKWQAILDVTVRPRDPAALAALNDLRDEAWSRGHWESVRECDLYRSVALKDHDLYLFTYFGTPFPAYRKRMSRIFGPAPTPPEWFERWYDVGAVDKSGVRVLDVAQGRELSSLRRLKPGQSMHRLLALLSSDFYRPFAMGAIFGRIHPEERFSTHTSQGRVHQVIHRLRRWFEENDVPLKVVETGGAYRLEATGPYGMRVALEDGPRETFDVYLMRLKELWQDRPFSAKDARAKLALSYSTMNRILAKGLEEKRLVKMGEGKKTSYKLVA